MSSLSVEDVVLNAEPNLTTALLKSVYASTVCIICQEMMHIPFSTTCGHTCCYECLNEWLTRQPQCPHCRTPILKEPVLNRSIQSVVESFVETAKIINTNITEQIEAEIEAVKKVYEHDRVKKILFKEIFSNATTCVIDRSDGVPRCGSCHWEAHGTQCLNCGVRFTIAPDEEDYYDGEEAYDEDHLEGSSSDHPLPGSSNFMDAIQRHMLRRYRDNDEDDESGASFIDDRSDLSEVDSDHVLDSEDEVGESLNEIRTGILEMEESTQNFRDWLSTNDSPRVPRAIIEDSDSEESEDDINASLRRSLGGPRKRVCLASEDEEHMDSEDNESDRRPGRRRPLHLVSDEEDEENGSDLGEDEENVNTFAELSAEEDVERSSDGELSDERW
ncbi:hypothetical protein BABINDRAFT_114027 [Babjeviella inositovora NRRL Y-12698]|uniref:RING-type domain-containing protein n=1 Tax=Babjeviella inositovora NRRL Y-12698 TaxID=984486 RepID=A0A1E3QWH5_9ASCO|nr:uncharacterized protein BABINDRAFT_114027 [Babjeviella inositovora NRRL Y-12698]ODQ81981.1 hypothetical protein BABINDRAFT_114027 [Babjeviella inositovora NRRL Y-12698]